MCLQAAVEGGLKAGPGFQLPPAGLADCGMQSKVFTLTALVYLSGVSTSRSCHLGEGLNTSSLFLLIYKIGLLLQLQSLLRNP